MYCKYCGSKVEDEARFCAKCGKLVEPDTKRDDLFEEQVYVDPIKEKEKDDLSGKALTFAIWSLVFSFISSVVFLCVASEGWLLPLLYGFEREDITLIVAFYSTISLVFPILGCIFSAVAKQKVDLYVEKFGDTKGRVSVGKGLRIPAKIFNIIMIVLNAIMIVVLFSLFNI